MAITDNMISYWKMDESSGNAADSVGSNTAVNTNVTYGTGKINNGAIFTSNNKRFTCGTGIAPSTALSISFWFNPQSNNLTNLGPVFVFKGNDGVDFGSFLMDGDSNNRVRFGCIAAHATPTIVYGYSPTITVNNNWYHCVGVYNGSNITVYMNGVAGTPQSYSNGIDTYTINTYLGNTNSTRTFNGYLDEVGMWSRALTSTEVTTLYNGGNGLQYPFTTTNVKNVDGLAYASVKSKNGLALASIKNFNGLA